MIPKVRDSEFSISKIMLLYRNRINNVRKYSLAAGKTKKFLVDT